MLAVVIENPGHAGVLKIEDRPAPRAGAGAVLIAVAAAGVNRADILQLQGKYPPPEGAPADIPGLEISGHVQAVGAGCLRYKSGDRVMALLPGGGYAEQVAVPEDHCLPVPDNIGLREAGGLPEALFTVWANLFVAARVQQGETVLVHGGTSGVGSMALQMLRAHGAVPLATAGSAEKIAWCLEHGAALAMDYKREDFTVAIMDETRGRGVDVILDMAGGDDLPRHLSCLAPMGRLVTIATQQGVKGELDFRALMRRRAVITGGTLRSRSMEEKARLSRAVERRVLPWLARGRIKPMISHYFTMSEAAEAHKILEIGAQRGKVAIEVGVC